MSHRFLILYASASCCATACTSNHKRTLMTSCPFSSHWLMRALAVTDCNPPGRLSQAPWSNPRILPSGRVKPGLVGLLTLSKDC